MKTAFLLCTPLQEGSDALKYGGPICIKTGSCRAYVGFATEDLAKVFCERWKIPDDTWIISATEFGSSSSPVLDRGIEKVVLFSDQATLEAYFSNPQGFPFEGYFVNVSSIRGSWLRRLFRQLMPNRSFH